MNAEILARLQFAYTIMFHYIFPPFTIGIGFLLVIYESLYLITKNKIYESITRFWIKIFAACFSVGVASGIVMEFEFGTNWSSYSRFVGDIFGSPLAAEGIFAFFLESGFLAILLFGWNRVKPGVHLFSTVMVALGSMMSAFWIVVANSWQQTPVAYEIVSHGENSRAVITDFWAMVFNPSAMVRFNHVIVGALLQGVFLVLSVAAYYYLKKRFTDFAQKTIPVAMGVATIASLTQLFLGHAHSKIVAEYQPAKLAAFEGLYHTSKGAPLYIAGITDPGKETTYGLKINGMLSYLIYGERNSKVRGLNEFSKEDWPPVAAVFQTYHFMVMLGMWFIFITLTCSLLLFLKKFYDKKWLLRFWVWMVPLPVIANQLGWVSAEVGRQPWLVYGLLRTRDGISVSVSAQEILVSVILFFIIYTLLFFVWLYVLDKEIKHGPGQVGEKPAVGYLAEAEKLGFFTKKKE
ncbi:MAG TPA: cytochrome ubiquinol oxidase subunit I [Cyclobacteriaceae bacterium]|nr:cytochrome ubiquinol oxidase subunit I [Cyclobacteriaceae bacterium]